MILIRFFLIFCQLAYILAKTVFQANFSSVYKYNSRNEYKNLTRDGLVKIVDTGSGFQAVAIDTIVSGVSMGISVSVSIRITVSTVSVTVISGIQIGGISFSVSIGTGISVTAFSGGTRDGLVQGIDTGSRFQSSMAIISVSGISAIISGIST